MTLYPSNRRIQGTTILQKAKDQNNVIGFFNYLLLFIGASRFVMGRIRQGLIFFALFLILYLWDKGKSSQKSRTAIYISEAGIEFKGWGAMNWSEIEALHIEYDDQQSAYTYHFRITFRNPDRGISDFSIGRLDIKPDQLAGLCERYIPQNIFFDLNY